jgi:uncharacterized repeat protein (TIGR01451 family)
LVKNGRISLCSQRELGDSIKKRLQRWSACGLFLWLAAVNPCAHAQTIPNAPTNLVATAVFATQISLSWADVSTNEDGFKIERSMDGTNFTQIAQVLPDTASYRNVGLFPNTAYHYRVRAYATGSVSDFSNAASATTLSLCPVSIVVWGVNCCGGPPSMLPELVAVSAGENFYLALKSDGTVVGWGDNYYGQLAMPSGLTGVVAVAAGGYHSLALKSDGTVVGWGYNAAGQINTPVGLTGVVAIAAGDYHSLALKSDGTVVGWGTNDWGEATPPPELSGVVAIAVSGLHSLALKSDGTVVGWGNNASGESTPPTNLTGVVAIAAGSYHSLALKSDGTVVAWGDTNWGATAVPTNLTGVVGIAGGLVHSLALKSDGTVVGWGFSGFGAATPPEGLTGGTAIAACGFDSVALSCAPNAPSSLMANAVSSSRTYLSWTDNSVNEVGFKIERAPDSGGSPGTWSQIATVNSNVTAYTDTGLAATTKYWYRVRAYNNGGNSPYGNQANATTLFGGANAWINPAGGKWETATNWSLGVLPASSQSVFILNLGAKTVAIDSSTVSAAPNSLNISNLTLNGVSGATNVLSVANVPTNTPFTILNSGVVGACTEMRLTNSNLRIAGTPVFTVDGRFWMTGGQMVCTSATLLVASGAQGQMIVSNGTVVTTQTQVSYAFGNYGTLTLVGSTLTASGVSLSIYGNSKGTIWLVNGSQLVATNVLVGAQDSADMIISNSTCTVGSLQVGYAGGMLQVAGGTVTVSQNLALGTAYGGNLWLSGGSHVNVVGDFIAGQHGDTQVGVSNSTLTARNIVLSGDRDASAALRIDGGVVTGSGSMTAGVGANGSSFGSIAITGGGQLILTNGSMILGNGYGQMIISNGTAFVRDLLVGATASSSGTLTVAGGTLQLGSTGTLEVRHGGALLVGSSVTLTRLIMTNGATGTLTFRTGTMSTQASTVSNSYPFVIGDGTDPATYYINGGVHAFANWLKISTNASLRGCGTIAASVVNDGTISVECGSALTFLGTVTNNTSIVVPNGMVVSFAALVVNNGTIDASAGGSAQFFGGVVNNGTILLPPQPIAPSGLLATAISSNHVDLAWSDNSSNEVGFLIERAPDNSGIPGTWAQIALVGSNVTTYSDAGLTPFTAFWYRVRAYNDSGYSPYSNQASAGHTVNHAPVAVNDTVNFWVGSSQLSFNVLTNDFDMDGDIMTVVAFTQPARGSLSYIGNGIFAYQPGILFTNGQDQFSYTIQDGFGGTDTANVLLRAQAHYLDGGDWPTFGNGPSHTGYYPGLLGTNLFVASWSNSFPLTINTIAVGGGGVYVTLPTFSSYTYDPFYLAAFDPQTGQQLWRYDFANGDAMNPPTYADGKIHTQRTNGGYDSQLWCISTNGTLVWSAPWDAQLETYYAPCVYGDGIWIGGGAFGGMYGFSTNGTQRFFFRLPQYAQWTPTYYQGTVYSWQVGTFRAHDPLNGNQLWSITVGGGHTVSAIEDGRAFVLSPKLYAIDLNTHAIAWTEPVNFVGSPAVHNGIVYGIISNEVRAFRTRDGTYLGTYKAMNDTALGTQPIVTDDALLVSSDTQTYVFDLDSHQLRQSIPFGGSLALATGRLYVNNNTPSAQLRTYVLNESTADLGVTITATPDPVALGSNLTYNISVTNRGVSTAVGAVLSDTLPKGIVYSSAVSSQGTCTYSNGLVICSLGDISEGAVASVDIIVIPTNAAAVSNTVAVQAIPPDPLLSNNTATVTTTAWDPLDRDGDGLPDNWEIQYFNSTNAPNGCASCDPDGDGFTNLQEFQAGTDPTNNASAFRIIRIAQEGDDVRVTWATAGGRTNVLQATSSLLGVYFNISPNIVVPGVGDVVTNYLDQGAARNTTCRFYRVALKSISIQDSNAPTLTITSPADNSLITNSTVTVTGTSADASGVSGVDVQGIAASSANGYSNWVAVVTGLADGTNTLTVLAGDNSAPANIATSTVRVICATGAFDGNGDGLPDGWQIKYFGAVNAPAAAPNADPDGDGISNLQEFLMGTDPTLPAPAAPSNLTVTAISATQINLFWTDNSSTEDGFKIERAPDSGGSPGTWTQIATVGANVTNYNDTGLLPGTRYWYRIRAYNVGGDSDYSNQASATTLLLTAPSGLTATAASTNRIDLSWADNSSNEDGFEIERAADDGGSPDAWSQIATVSANVTNYSDSGLPPGTKYWYRVRAYNTSGSSDYSNQASAATPALCPRLVVGWGNNSYGQATPPAGLDWVTAIAAGFGHSLALKSDGTVVGWGDNYNGIATPPAGLSNVVAIAAGAGHSLALKSDGSVVAWGSADAPPAGLSNVVAIAAGSYNSLALKSDGTVVGWGEYGPPPPVGLSNVVAIAARSYHSLALKSDGTVVGWGSYAPPPPAGLSNVVAIAAGGGHSLALKSDGTVVGWGYNEYGQTNVPPGLTGVVAIAAGAGHSLALKSDGTVVGWGDNSYGQATPPAGLTRVTAIAAGYSYGLALTLPCSLSAPSSLTATAVSSRQINLSWMDNSGDEDGFKIERATSDSGPWTQIAQMPGNTTGYHDANLVPGATYYYRVRASNSRGDSDYSNISSASTPTLCPASVVGWGRNSYGQTRVPTNLTDVVAITAGYSHSLALKSDGTVVGWGNLYYATPPPGLTGVVAIAAGYYHSLALKSDGTVVGWGDMYYATPPTNLAEVVAIAAGYQHSLALKSDGTVVGWGDNSYGQTNPPAGMSGVVAIAAGASHSLALESDGTVVGWGSGSAATPPPLLDAVAISAGYSHSLALKSDGTVIGWGSNTAGKKTPPAGLNGVVAIAAGTIHSLALKSDGTIVVWGDNSYGQTNLPTGLSGVVAIAAGHYHNLAMSCAPGAPSALAATGVAAHQIDLSWTDRSSNEERFGIERSLSSTGPWIEIGSVDSNVTTYSGTGVSCGQTYYYRVRAYNAAAGSPYSNVTSANTSAVDADGDGIRDCWTLQYFGHPTGQASDNSRAADDADGDGMSNLREYLTGTDPTNGASALRIIGIAQEGDDVCITWTTAGGRTNTVQATAGDADGGYTTNFVDLSGLIIILGSGDTTTNYVDIGGATNAPSRYYRIRLVP